MREVGYGRRPAFGNRAPPFDFRALRHPCQRDCRNAQSMAGDDISRLVSIDLWYGILALLILIVGFSRAIFAAKGWAYYSVNSFFWAKIAVFVLISLLSIWPTLKYLNWRRDFRSAGVVPDAASVSIVRRILWLELVLFAFSPAFAAAMARGYGE